MRRLPLVRLVAAACCALPLASAADDAAYSYEQASSYEGGGEGQGEAMLDWPAGSVCACVGEKARVRCGVPTRVCVVC